MKLDKELKLQKEQYETTILGHLSFIDQVGAQMVESQRNMYRFVLLSDKYIVFPHQLISDKKALTERCEGVLAELKQVDQKYTKKISQMQEQHEMVRENRGKRSRFLL